MCVGVGFNKPYVWGADRGGEGTLMCSRGEDRRATSARVEEGRGSQMTGRATAARVGGGRGSQMTGRTATVLK